MQTSNEVNREVSFPNQTNSENNKNDDDLEYETQLLLWHSRLLCKDTNTEDNKDLLKYRAMTQEHSEMSLKTKRRKKYYRDNKIYKSNKQQYYIDDDFKNKCVEDSSTSTYQVVAKTHGLSLTTIWRWRKQKRLPSLADRKQIFTKEMEDQLMQWYNQQPNRTVTYKTLRKKALSIANNPVFKGSKNWIIKLKKKYSSIQFANSKHHV